ncbi:hypothetical protein HRR83_006280 [Exophiala dermatitidis]|nr:hypothetical protein HRR73_007139 [Exophiala dermatitidis]KAJ4509472.1 hypothetical protein HRR74_007253 [Exophiala dermatitidis]KAJ4530470.1 hypothetical protein HRR76_008180 [Exophiala dermatitidis]KAJ4545360.1 hypothetical protein HRR77_005206 [Exophiala dermatitidis]KAJ4571777.1 hypothetical protein HRR82_007060 [Exophiala dermatitidis]
MGLEWTGDQDQDRHIPWIPEVYTGAASYLKHPLHVLSLLANNCQWHFPASCVLPDLVRFSRCDTGLGTTTTTAQAHTSIKASESFHLLFVSSNPRPSNSALPKASIGVSQFDPISRTRISALTTLQADPRLDRCRITLSSSNTTHPHLLSRFAESHGLTQQTQDGHLPIG